MSACLFCERLAEPSAITGGAIYADDLFHASHYFDGEEPAYLGNLIIQTRRHVPTLGDMTNDEGRAFGLLVARLGRALKAVGGAEKVYIEGFAETVPHVHVFLRARYPGTPNAYLRWHVMDWLDAPNGGPREVAALSARLRTHLESETLEASPRAEPI
jgi:diadenosine tetraphosphate (Ap4A) HIT family hydrolase